MKRFALALLLACALSTATLAGDIPSTGTPDPGDIPSTDSPTPPDPGDIPSTGTSLWLTILDLAF